MAAADIVRRWARGWSRLVKRDRGVSRLGCMSGQQHIGDWWCSVRFSGADQAAGSLIHRCAASIWPAGKGLIVAATKWEASLGAMVANGASVTTAILRTCL